MPAIFRDIGVHMIGRRLSRFSIFGVWPAGKRLEIKNDSGCINKL